MFDIDLSNLKAVNQKDFIMKQSQEYREKTNYNAFYMAVVINSNDPEELGRVQIRIPALHGTRKNQNYFIEDSELPWARPGIFATGGNDMGQFLVPQKGNRVFVTFEFNNPSNPIYFGGIPTLIGKVSKQYNDNPDIYNGNTVEITDNDKIKSKSKSKANQIVYKSFKGATIEINDKDGQESIKIIDASGQVFEMGVLDPEGVPLPRRGDKENSTNDYRFIKLGNENEFIEIIDGKIKIVADDVDISGYKPGGGDGADEVQISKEEPTKDSIELWVDLDDNTPPVPAEVVVDPDYVHTDNNFTDALKEKLEGIDLSDVGAIKIIKRNGVAGLIVGANEDGKVFAENDGTGSVVGWDNLKNKVDENSSSIANLDKNKLNKNAIYTILTSVASTYTTLEGFIVEFHRYNTSLNSYSTDKFVIPISSDEHTGLISYNDKAKLDGIEDNAQVNKIEKIQKNGVDLDITNKIVNITIPVNLSELVNDEGFIDLSTLNQRLTTELANYLPINGNAVSASKLQTARKINGVNFDGTQDITIPVADVDSLTSQATSRTCDLPLDIT